MTIVLDNIRSSWNVGSIMRTCDAINANLILVGYTPRPVGKTYNLIKKTAIGAQDTVNCEYFEHFQEVFHKYPSKHHFAIEITKQSTNIFNFLKDYHLPDNKTKPFLWFGNEIHGVSQEICQRCNRVLHLPMLGTKESLNVAGTVTAVGYLFLQHNLA